jgi:hypothetical protein
MAPEDGPQSMRAFAFLVPGALLALACSPANVGGVDAGPSADSVCTDDAYARCSRYQTCSPTTVQIRFGDETTCNTVYKAFCLANLGAPSTGTTISGLQTCTQQIPEWACSDFLEAQNTPPGCATPSGQIAAGAVCSFSGQCQSAFCAIVPGATCGVCAATPQAGDSCAQLTQCGPSLTCLSSSETCAGAAGPMASCAPAQSCTVGNECIGANYTTGAPGTCQAAVETLGDPCSSTTNECDYYAGLTCNSQSKQCVQLTVNGAGQPCDYIAASGQTFYCGAGGKCITSTPGGPGTCTGSSPIGGTCDLVMGPACVPPARCIAASEGGTSGTCQVPDGSACQ